MGAKFFGLATLAVMGIIAADVLTHPKGTASAATGVSNILRPTYNALLGRGV